MNPGDLERFKNLTYEGFRELAKQSSLSPHEKIGFPNSYREGKEAAIFADICAKLGTLDGAGGPVLDIGPGCAGLAHLIIDRCRETNREIHLVDSAEMLRHLPDGAFVRKLPGFFPRDFASFVDEHAGRFRTIIVYSVLHYIFREAPLFEFLDASLRLLAHGGEMLIGDIPNVSMRRRFFSSPGGVAFHKAFTGTDTSPSVEFNALEPGAIDDAVVFSILLRCRAAGFDAWVVPQRGDLPMANRREDILVRRP